METAINAMPDVHQAAVLRGGFSVRLLERRTRLLRALVCSWAHLIRANRDRHQKLAGFLAKSKYDKGP